LSTPELREFSANLKTLTLCGLETGDPNGPVAIALHGWLDNSLSFEPVLNHLKSSNYRVIAIDFPGHGLSDHRAADGLYYFIEWVADVIALIDYLEADDVYLIGHSMGGFVAQIVAATIPDKVSKMTLIEAFGLMAENPDKTTEQLRKSFADRRKLNGREAPVYPDAERLVKLRSEASELDVDTIRPLVMRNLQQVDGGYSWRVDPRIRLASPFRFTPEQARDILLHIECPIQFIKGKTGYKRLNKALEIWQDCVPELVVHEVTGGHHLHMESPEIVAKLILEL